MKKVNVNSLFKKGAKTLDRSELKLISGGGPQETDFLTGGTVSGCGKPCDLDGTGGCSGECNQCATQFNIGDQTGGDGISVVRWGVCRQP
ncbi:hypothetical protein [uncultured Aquimarina sp.]|uniref:hypothetical protein n=1 Tax=uncultured Aquimarina sp. TaxID=575652 RepID=UPI002606F08A|nr:hypothetical protein [uncultured Aquimarina sp.]